LPGSAQYTSSTLLCGAPMAEQYIAVIDAGSSRVRFILLGQDGQVAASGETEWTYKHVDGASPYAREFDAAETWSGIGRLMQHVLSESSIASHDVAAIAVTGQRQAIAFLDEVGDALYIGPNLDLRAVFEGAAIDDELGDRVHSTTGHIPSFLFAPAKARWLREHRPHDFSRITSTVTLVDWIVLKVSGQLGSEPALAGEAGLLDVSNRSWCSALLSELGMPGNDHVPMLHAGSVLGEVPKSAAAMIGLRAGTPVVVAGPDTQCGLLGMGMVSPGETGIVAGWSAPVQMLTDKPMPSKDSETWAGCHVIENTWTVESGTGDTGNSYTWLIDTLWGDGNDAFDLADRSAAAVAPGAEGALAYLGASPSGMGHVGMRLGGLAFPVPITFSKPGKGQLARAALEAMAYASRASLERVERVSGHTATKIAVGGGMLRTTTYARVLADVLGREVRTPLESNVSARGAFICAATALGWHRSLADGANAAAASMKPIAPDPETSLVYGDLYTQWLDVHGQMGSVGL
jgi:sugar (pentulose or hexulose) kinase